MTGSATDDSITHRLAAATARESMLTGRRYAAVEALDAGIVDATAAEAEVVDRAVERIAPLASKPREVQRAIKQGISRDAIAALEQESRNALEA